MNRILQIPIVKASGWQKTREDLDDIIDLDFSIIVCH